MAGTAIQTYIDYYGLEYQNKELPYLDRIEILRNFEKFLIDTILKDEKPPIRGFDFIKHDCLKLISKNSADCIVFRCREPTAMAGNSGENLGFVLKVPKSIETDRLAHEALIGIYGLNKLRNLIPNFMYILDYWRDSPLVLIGEKILISPQLSTLIKASQVPTSNENDTDAPGKPTFNGLSYLLAEHIRGVTLAHFIQSNKLQDKDMLINILLQIFNALHVAHEKYNFIHCDLHCGNIMIKELTQEIKISLYDIDLQEYLQISTRHLVYIIDYGRSQIDFATGAGRSNGAERTKPVTIPGLLVDNFGPDFDIYKLLGYMAYEFYANKEDEKTEPLPSSLKTTKTTKLIESLPTVNNMGFQIIMQIIEKYFLVKQEIIETKILEKLNHGNEFFNLDLSEKIKYSTYLNFVYHLLYTFDGNIKGARPNGSFGRTERVESATGRVGYFGKTGRVESATGFTESATGFTENATGKVNTFPVTPFMGFTSYNPAETLYEIYIDSKNGDSIDIDEYINYYKLSHKELQNKCEIFIHKYKKLEVLAEIRDFQDENIVKNYKSKIEYLFMIKQELFYLEKQRLNLREILANGTVANGTARSSPEKMPFFDSVYFALLGERDTLLATNKNIQFIRRNNAVQKIGYKIKLLPFWNNEYNNLIEFF